MKYTPIHQKGYAKEAVIAMVAVIFVVIFSTAYYFGGKTVEAPVVETPGEPLPPELVSVVPANGKIGTSITVYGKNLSGFEGDKNLWIQNISNGVRGIMRGDAGSTNTSITAVLADRYCTADTSYSGLECPAYLVITPGAYKIYAEPWGKKSNELLFTVK